MSLLPLSPIFGRAECEQDVNQRYDLGCPQTVHLMATNCTKIKDVKQIYILAVHLIDCPLTRFYGYILSKQRGCHAIGRQLM